MFFFFFFNQTVNKVTRYKPKIGISAPPVTKIYYFSLLQDRLKGPPLILIKG